MEIVISHQSQLQIHNITICTYIRCFDVEILRYVTRQDSVFNASFLKPLSDCYFLLEFSTLQPDVSHATTADKYCMFHIHISSRVITLYFPCIF